MGLRFTALALAGLIVTGLLAASPYLCDRLVGTGEAYNYSLSVADAMEQMRAGVVPPLAGQSVYAFNGRIHPLRNAPYLFYLCAAIDLATRHRLTPWEIQNVSLTLSLIGAGLACFIGLRWGLGCPPIAAFLLAVAYALSPPLLGAAYSFDLFMTVHVAVFVPLAVGACMRGILVPSFSADAWLAATVAAAWLTHPPVALWLTAGVLFVRLFAFCVRPTVGAVLRGTLAVCLAGCLAAFVFASATAHSQTTGSLAKGAGSGLAPLIMHSIRVNFADSVRPVARDAGGLGSLQLGYLGWILFAAAGWLAVRGIRREGLRDAVRIAAVASLAFVFLLLLLLVPVPVLTGLLWRCVPGVALELTTIWPMQRLYLVAFAFTVAAAALVLPRNWNSLWRPRWMGYMALVLAAAWTGYEARAYIHRGYGDRRSYAETVSLYRPSNINLTETSYAYVGFSPTYVAGVMDPMFEFRLLKNGTEPAISNIASADSEVRTVKSVALLARRKVQFTLEPGKRYVLSFGFRTRPMVAAIFIDGKYIHRTYSLPTSGAPEAFGMRPGQPTSIPIWTDSNKTEPIEIMVDAPELATPAGAKVVFADLTLKEVDTGKLPIRLLSLIPLRFAVTAPDEGYTVETPRSFIPGYTATINGRPARTLMSPGRQVMVPVPSGESVIELECKGPARVYQAFWLSAGAWLGLFVWRLSGSRYPKSIPGFARGPAEGRMRTSRRYGMILAVAAAVIVGVIVYTVRERHQRTPIPAAGPISIDFTLPYGRAGASQPLISSGKPGAGGVVFVHLIDEKHVRIGADIWGALYQSGPIEVDLSKIQNLVLSDSAFFPLENPDVKALRPSELQYLRGHVLVELNGRTVINENRFAYETSPDEIRLGHTQFVSATDPDFTGEILASRRLVIPRTLITAGSSSALVKVRFPEGMQGITEPLLSISCAGRGLDCRVTYLGPRRVGLSCVDSDNRIVASSEADVDFRSEHTLVLSLNEKRDRSHGLAVGCTLDGKLLISGGMGQPPTTPIVVTSGVAAFGRPGVSKHFTGSELDLDLRTDGESAGSSPADGPEHLVVRFPTDKVARHEPLLVCGRAGTADVVYVVYEDGGHVRLGYDHWGVGETKSDSIAADYSAPHEIWVVMDSLYPIHPGLKASPTRVYFDGRLVLQSGFTPYRVPSNEIVVGKNAIGASTADPLFTGSIDFEERAGPKLPQTPGS